MKKEGIGDLSTFDLLLMPRLTKEDVSFSLIVWKVEAYHHH
jgi:hypothetical protein